MLQNTNQLLTAPVVPFPVLLVFLLIHFSVSNSTHYPTATTPLNTWTPLSLTLAGTMSQAGSEGFTSAPLLPSAGSERGSVLSIRGWTIPKLTASYHLPGLSMALWPAILPLVALAARYCAFKIMSFYTS